MSIKEEMELDLELDDELNAEFGSEVDLQQDIKEELEDLKEEKEAMFLVSDEPVDRFEALPRQNSIYLSGVDDMSTDDVKTFINNSENLVKVEWIDDSSCNLVMNTDEQAQSLAKELLAEESTNAIDHRNLLKAKPFTRQDNAVNTLFVRISTEDDAKRKGARQRSQYYRIYGTEGSELSNERVEERKGMIERMKKNGGDGRSVFERLGNRVDEGRRDRRSASPERSRSRSPVQRDIPDRLKHRLGPQKRQEEQEE